MSDLKSPCIQVCALNKEDVCTGCWRSVKEIQEWRGMTQDQRITTLTRAQQRIKKAGLAF